VTRFGFGGRCENWLGQLGGQLESRRQLNPANALRFLIFLPTGTGQITAHHAFDRQRFGLLYDHGAPGELLAERLQFFWGTRRTSPDKVIPDVVESLEPKRGNLIQYCALVRNGIGKNHIKCGDPIRDDKEQCLAQIEHFAHLAAAQFFNSVKID
jgi:hypothetical protein